MFSAYLFALVAAGSAGAGAPDPQGGNAGTVRQEASVTVRLEVNEAGAADKCEIEKTDAPAELAGKVCPIFLTKAKFKPQLDAKGVPQRTSMTQTVKFAIEQ